MGLVRHESVVVGDVGGWRRCYRPSQRRSRRSSPPASAALGNPASSCSGQNHGCPAWTFQSTMPGKCTRRAPNHCESKSRSRHPPAVRVSQYAPAICHRLPGAELGTTIFLILDGFARPHDSILYILFRRSILVPAHPPRRAASNRQPGLGGSAAIPADPFRPAAVQRVNRRRWRFRRP